MTKSNSIDISIKRAGESSVADDGRLEQFGVEVDSDVIRVTGDSTGQERRIVAIQGSSLTVACTWKDVVEKIPAHTRIVSPAALGLLLRCGFVPSPYSIYENVYQLGIGDQISVDTTNGTVGLGWRYPFEADPYSETETWDDAQFESRLVEAMRNALRHGPSCLLLSAGKDSMALLHAATIARPANLECITYAPGYRETEHLIAMDAANASGFPHRAVEPDSKLQLKLLLELARKAPHPSFDFALPSTLLCAYHAQTFANGLIDGLGNDKYMYVTPSTRERVLLRAAIGSAIGWFWGRFAPISRSDYLNYLGFSVSSTPVERWFPGTRVGVKWIKNLGGDWREAREIIRDIDNTVRGYGFFNGATIAKARYSDYCAAMEKTRLSAESFNLSAEFPFCDHDLIAYYTSIKRDEKMSAEREQGKLAFKTWVRKHARASEYYTQKGSFRFDSRRLFADEGKEISALLSKHIPALRRRDADRLVSIGASSYVASQQVYLVMMCAVWLGSLSADQKQKLRY